MNSNTCGAKAASRPPGSFFTVLDELERAASRLPSVAEYSAQVANMYLGSPAEVWCSDAPKEPDDPNVVRRLIALARCIDEAARQIDYNLNRLSE